MTLDFSVGVSRCVGLLSEPGSKGFDLEFFIFTRKTSVKIWLERY
jgi:hypothetical protein